MAVRPVRALWLAACACACALATPAEERVRARCASDAGARCRPTNDTQIFIVNGVEHKIDYAEDGWYTSSCAAAPLEDAAWPRLPALATVPSATLAGCAPPAAGYVAALRALNVSASESLELRDVPAGRAPPAALAGAPPALALSAADGTLALAPGALAELTELRTLRLTRVRFDRLPPHLDTLKLAHTGIETLPPEALNVIDLEIEEANLTSATGSALRMEALTLDAPAAELPQAPALRRLWLAGAAAERPPAGLAAAIGALRVLGLRRAAAPAPPPALLRSASQLRVFHALECNYTTLPADFFADSPLLEIIRLNDNKLETLPRELFAQLPRLRTLELARNQLTARALRAVSAAVSLRALVLNGNPLGDLCPEGLEQSALSPLMQLQRLELANASVPRLCGDWVRDMTQLLALRLPGNALRSLACADLRVRRVPVGRLRDTPLIDLSDNPLEHVECARSDYQRAVTDPEPEMVTRVIHTASLRCDCGAFWLSLVVRERHSAVDFVPVYEQPDCSAEWLYCTFDEEEAKPEYTPGTWWRAACLPDYDPLQLTSEQSKHYETVLLERCPPPAGRSYAAALRASGVGVGRTLSLAELDDVSLTAAALADLPRGAELRLAAARGVLRPAPGALAGLRAVRTLVLSRVRPDRLPPHLDVLKLNHTGLPELPVEALNVRELTMDEEQLPSIPGTLPRLQRLWLRGGCELLPRAPSLAALLLHGCSALPATLLHGAVALQRFTATKGSLVTLPPNLFADTTKLEYINLSDNHLESLPKELFSGLKKLHTLRLENNRLRAGALGAVGSLTPVTFSDLVLSDNPLGDLCPDEDTPSSLSALKWLQTLRLARTNATRVCGDWLRALERLSVLDLRGNDITSLSCARLVAVRAPRRLLRVAPYVDLNGNALVRIYCTRKDFESLGEGGPPDQTVKLRSNSVLRCNCGAFWAERVLRARVASIAFRPVYDRAPCRDQWRHCLDDDVDNDACGLVTPRGQALSIGGEVAERGELPWHAGVYHKNGTRRIQICGGTLVSTKVVISAAHCFWSDRHKQLPAEEFTVALGSLRRQWAHPSDEGAQHFDVSSLQLPDRFLGGANNFQFDIALVVLSRAAEPAPHVRPVCVDFDAPAERRQLHAAALGKVAGWGLVSETRRVYSATLLTLELPVVPVEECQRDARPDFREFITVDKFCAGYRNGTAALCRGDSGGGLSFPSEVRGYTRYFLRGVVSTAPREDGKVCSAQWLTTFTQISAHEEFIAEHVGL